MAPEPNGRVQQRSVETRRALVDAAVDVLRHDGFGAATARTIAARAGCNQGLVFYHFGSVTNLLLAALDQVSEGRRARYDAALVGVGSPGQLVGLAADIFREDLDSGNAAVLVEMLAGCSSSPGLGPRVKARVEPWAQFVVNALERTLPGPTGLAGVPMPEIAHAIVALYLGLELLSHLDGDRAAALALFDRARQLAGLADLFTERPPAPSTPDGTTLGGTSSDIDAAEGPEARPATTRARRERR